MKRKRRRIPPEEMTDKIRKKAKRRRITWRLDVVNIFGEKVATKYVSPNGSWVQFNHNEKRMKEVDLYPIIEGVKRILKKDTDPGEEKEKVSKKNDL